MKTWGLVLILAVLAGVIAAVAVSIAKSKPLRKKPFQQLLQDSLAVECLTGHHCSTWFKEQSTRFQEAHLGLLLYANRQFIGLLGYECPPETDLQNYLLQLLVKEEGSDILAYRLINYADIEPNLKARLDVAGKLSVEL